MVGEFNYVSLSLVKEKGSKWLKAVVEPKDVLDALKPIFENSDREKFAIVILDTKKYIVAVNVVSIGTLNETIAHPREVFKAAILSNANSIIIAHNHPSGDTTPSSEDINLTKRLIKCGEILGIPVIDHVIVGADTWLGKNFFTSCYCDNVYLFEPSH